MNNIYEYFTNSSLHDYELKNLYMDYEKDVLTIAFKDKKREESVVIINNINSFYIERKEPWGVGKYVVSSEVEKEEEKCIIRFQMNSGDKCIIECYSNDM